MMSRVKQRVAIGCPRSPRVLCTVLREGGEGRVVGCARARSQCCVITHVFVILLQGHESFFY